MVKNMNNFKKGLIEAGFAEELTMLTNLAISEILIDPDYIELRKTLELKTMYSLKAESLGSKMDSIFILKAVEAHENYLIVLKRYQPIIDNKIFELVINIK